MSKRRRIGGEVGSLAMSVHHAGPAAPSDYPRRRSPGAVQRPTQAEGRPRCRDRPPACALFSCYPTSPRCARAG